MINAEALLALLDACDDCPAWTAGNARDWWRERAPAVRARRPLGVEEVAFSASGEPATGKADMLEVRDGPLQVDPQTDGPLLVRGNLEITSGTGRVVARLVQARLCRCGASGNKPFCDGSHVRVGFKSS